MKNIIRTLIFLVPLIWNVGATATNHTVNLSISYKTFNFTGNPTKAIVVNQQIPAPTLHFKQGDQICINVHNHLDQGTAIHWHGVLVPWQMDGVEGVTQKPIPANGVFHYRFTLEQAGTYWYHAHAGLQEQQGLYGAFIIDPIKPPFYHYNKDLVIVLSDWSNTNPQRILANLKKDGDYYASKFPLQPSLFKFIHDYHNASNQERNMLVQDYKMMQQMLMSIYDFSDVAYDAFLLNGRSCSHPWTAVVKVGDIVRLRFIGANASTNFRIKIPNAKMQIVHVDGNDIQPHTVSDFTLAPGETYDVLIKIQKNEPYIIYAEAADTSGAAYGALLTNNSQQQLNLQNIIPFPQPKPVTREMLHNMELAMHSPGSSMQHMKMPTEPTLNNDTIVTPDSTHRAIATLQHSMPMQMSHATMSTSSLTTGTKYQNLIAATTTNNPDKAINGVIKIELFGYMNHFLWFINGIPEYKAKPILLAQNKRYRMIFINNSMMHHPMHIHGHWFILRNGHGAFDPLLHTIDIPPSATVVADVDTDASGQWFFHCHHLYHMVAGMSRVLQYATIIQVAQGTRLPQSELKQTAYENRPIIREDESLPLDPTLIEHPMPHATGFYVANFFDVGMDPFNNIQKINYKGLFGGDYNKLELFTNDAELKKGKVQNADIDIFYWHLLNQFWNIKGGINYFYRPAAKPYLQPGIGIEGLLPYFIDTDIRAYAHSGSIKFDIEFLRDTQITNNFFIRAAIRGLVASKTVTTDSIGSGINTMRYLIRPYYRLNPNLNIFAEYEHTQNYGAFKNLQVSAGESARADSLTFGLAVLL